MDYHYEYDMKMIDQPLAVYPQESKRPFDRLVMRPGPGWDHVAGNVWEHCSGIRIHRNGYIKLPDGTVHSAHTIPECFEADLFIRMNGGNYMRGLMAWSRKMLGP